MCANIIFNGVIFLFLPNMKMESRVVTVPEPDKLNIAFSWWKEWPPETLVQDKALNSDHVRRAFRVRQSEMWKMSSEKFQVLHRLLEARTKMNDFMAKQYLAHQKINVEGVLGNMRHMLNRIQAGTILDLPGNPELEKKVIVVPVLLTIPAAKVLGIRFVPSPEFKVHLLNAYVWNAEILLTSPHGLHERISKYWLGISLPEVTRWLMANPAIQVHRPIPDEIPVTAIHSAGPSQHFQLDTAYVNPPEDGYVRYLAMTDMYTKFLWTWPLKSGTAKEVVTVCGPVIEDRLANFRARWGGQPGNFIIQSDNGSEFMSEFAEMVKIWGVAHKRGKAHHPQTQGAVERINRTIKRHLAILKSTGRKLPFAAKLSKVTDSYNLRTHESTGYKPADLEMMYSRPDARTSAKVAMITEVINKHWNARAKQYLGKWKHKTIIKQGSLVRVTLTKVDSVVRDKAVFRKKYEEQWSQSMYVVMKVSVGASIQPGVASVDAIENLNPYTKPGVAQKLEHGPVYWLKKVVPLPEYGKWQFVHPGDPFYLYGNVLLAISYFWGMDHPVQTTIDITQIAQAPEPKKAEPQVRPKAMPPPPRPVVTPPTLADRPDPSGRIPWTMRRKQPLKTTGSGRVVQRPKYLDEYK